MSHDTRTYGTIIHLVLKLYHLTQILNFVWYVKCLASGSNIQKGFGWWRSEAGGWSGSGSLMEISLVVRNHIGSCYSRSKQRRSLGKELLLLLLLLLWSSCGRGGVGGVTFGWKLQLACPLVWSCTAWSDDYWAFHFWPQVGVHLVYKRL